MSCTSNHSARPSSTKARFSNTRVSPATTWGQVIEEKRVGATIKQLSDCLSNLDFDRFFKVFKPQNVVYQIIEAFDIDFFISLLVHAFPAGMPGHHEEKLPFGIASEIVVVAKEKLEIELSYLDLVFKRMQKEGLEVESVRTSVEWMRKRNAETYAIITKGARIPSSSDKQTRTESQPPSKEPSSYSSQHLRVPGFTPSVSPCLPRDVLYTFTIQVPPLPRSLGGWSLCNINSPGVQAQDAKIAFEVFPLGDLSPNMKEKTGLDQSKSSTQTRSAAITRPDASNLRDHAPLSNGLRTHVLQEKWPYNTNLPLDGCNMHVKVNYYQSNQTAGSHPPSHPCASNSNHRYAPFKRGLHNHGYDKKQPCNICSRELNENSAAAIRSGLNQHHSRSLALAGNSGESNRDMRAAASQYQSRLRPLAYSDASTQVQESNRNLRGVVAQSNRHYSSHHVLTHLDVNCHGQNHILAVSTAGGQTNDRIRQMLHKRKDRRASTILPDWPL